MNSQNRQNLTRDAFVVIVIFTILLSAVWFLTSGNFSFEAVITLLTQAGTLFVLWGKLD